MGPLLAFADAALEGAFEAEFHARRLPLDRLYLTVVVCLDVLLLIWKLAPQGRSFACALLATEALAAAALLLWQRRQPAAYLARRSATIAVFVVAHALVRSGRRAGVVQRRCMPHALWPYCSPMMPSLPLMCAASPRRFPRTTSPWGWCTPAPLPHAAARRRRLGRPRWAGKRCSGCTRRCCSSSPGPACLQCSARSRSSEGWSQAHQGLQAQLPWGRYQPSSPLSACRLACRTAVWAQAAAVGALMLPPVAARRLAVSTQLCASAGARYAAAVRLVCSAVGCLLPPVLGAEVQELALRLPESAAVHMVSGLAQLALSFAAPLAVLVRRELRARLEFARARGDAAAVAGLRHRGRSWQLSPIEWSLVGATLWCLSLCAAAALHGPPE